MTENFAKVTAAPMEGRGAYNRSSRVQAAGASPAVGWLAEAARLVAPSAGIEPVVVADYGASQGKNSLGPMRVAIGQLRARVGPERAISVVHTDLPGNDFSALFQVLENDPESYLRGDGAVFASAVGRSFYEQVLPAGSVTLGWSSWAVQWLSRVPAVIPDHIQAALSKDAEARAANELQAGEDWRAFLTHRAREMRTGAQLVVLTMAKDAGGDFGYGAVMAAMYGGLLALVDEGFVSMDEVRRMAIPTVARSREEIELPFGTEGRFEGLVLERLEVFDGEDRIWEEFERTGDAGAFGAQWAAFSRASVFPTLAAELDGGPGDARGAEFLERLELGMAQRLAAGPGRMKIPLARMVLGKGI